MSPELPEDIRQRISDICTQHKVVELELVQRGSKAKPVFEVVVDTEAGVTFEECRSVHRDVEALLDAAPSVSESYRLDVTSPGIDRPLEHEWQYRKNIGRKVAIETKHNGSVSGRIKQVESGKVSIESKSGTQDFDLNDIEKAVIEIEF